MPISTREVLLLGEVRAGLPVLIAVEPDVVVLRNLEREVAGRLRFAFAIPAADIQRSAVFAFSAGHRFHLQSGLFLDFHSYYSTFRPKMQGFSEKFSGKNLRGRIRLCAAADHRTSAA